MTRNTNKSFTPDYAVAPGRTLVETMAASRMTQTELALRTGLARKTINGIINDREPITPDTAIRLEKVFRVPAHFWNNLQKNYEEAKARLREREILAEYVDWPQEIGIPVCDLIKRGLIPDARDKIDLLSEVLKFFGVATPAEFSAVWSEAQSEWAREKKEIKKGEFGAVAARMRMATLAGLKFEG